MPIDNFTMVVLRILNVAPSQLHPNIWVAIQAFRALCSFFRFESTVRLFLYYFRTWPTDKAQWLSLIHHQDRPLFRPFMSSYKNFKMGFSKWLSSHDWVTTSFMILMVGRYFHFTRNKCRGSMMTSRRSIWVKTKGIICQFKNDFPTGCLPSLLFLYTSSLL